MGYTHYFYLKPTLDEENFIKVVQDFEKMIPKLEHLGVKLAGGDGSGLPTINEDEIIFNGVAKCGHQERNLGVTWPSEKANGVASLQSQHRDGNQTLADTEGQWFAGLKLNARTCGGDCSHETFELVRKAPKDNWHKVQKKHEVSYIGADNKPVYEDEKTAGYYFSFTKTAYKPYDLAVNVCGIIAKHNLGNQILVHSDGDLKDWSNAMELCQHFLGYGKEFVLDE